MNSAAQKTGGWLHSEAIRLLIIIPPDLLQPGDNRHMYHYTSSPANLIATESDTNLSKQPPPVAPSDQEEEG